MRWIRWLFRRRKPEASKPKHVWNRFIPRFEDLDKRIVPAQFTTWMGNQSILWSNAGNWSNGLPDASKVVVLDGTQGSNTNINYDNTVLADNRTVAGIKTQNGYSATLNMLAGFALTVAGSASDTDTGFKWSSGNIAQTTASDVLIITGGPGSVIGGAGASIGSGSTTSNNIWSGGTIGSGTTLSNIYIEGESALRITQSATALGDNIIIGQDSNGGSTLEFYNQSSTLQVNNNAYLSTATNPSDLTAPNQILFDTDLTQGGTASKELATTSADAYIDNYGQIIRSNPGILQIDLPIRNHPIQASGDRGLLDLQSSLLISGSSVNKTVGYSLDQEGGTTLLENGSTLKVNNAAFINGGYLQTYGGTQAIIQANLPQTAPDALIVRGGTMDFSADNHALYGSLRVLGNMSWTGGTFECYINGNTAGQQTQLSILGDQMGILSISNNAHLHMNVVGALTSGLTWAPVDFTSRTGTLTFDSGNLFNIAYIQSQITVTSQ